ncbi:SAG family member [Eimeria mitis]|uniref:SAG family member n=1 Tax=Eimeria mitis TaxID=44415 RepID=U6K7K1_9EIME|nr:SAG family member [Eimeria mitis]CDJ31458.1 SAG family member [Eimeria mitis]
MRKLSSVLLAAAVLGAAHEVESADSDEKGSAAPADCLVDFNAARERAGLEAFIAETDAEKQLPTGKDEYLAAICSAIQKASGGATSEITVADVKREGTYAYAPETGPADGCSAAVSYWKKAYVNFGELPPEYKEDTDVYKDSRNISLVALYNPQDGATVDCAYITCPVSTTTTTTTSPTPSVTSGTTDAPTTQDASGGVLPSSADPEALSPAGSEVQGRASAGAPTSSPVSRDEESEDLQKTGPSVRRLSTPSETVSETVTGLVCLTNPAALLQGKKPFSEGKLPYLPCHFRKLCHCDRLLICVYARQNLSHKWSCAHSLAIRCAQGAVSDISVEDAKREGTYAYAPETGPDDGCSAAVSYWKGAHVNFGELPPEYKDDTDVYADSRNISLVALYNPQDGATVDCAYITCPVSTTTTTTTTPTTSVTSLTSQAPATPDTSGDSEGLSPAGSEVQGRASAGAPTSSAVSRDEEYEDPQKTGPSVRRLSTPSETVSETVTGLVCLTNPAALVQGKKPFSEDVWANIKEAIENSASASTKSALLAIALLLLTSFSVL